MTGWKLIHYKIYTPVWISGIDLNGFLGQVSVRHNDEEDEGQADELPLPWSDWDCVRPKEGT